MSKGAAYLVIGTTMFTVGLIGLSFSNLHTEEPSSSNATNTTSNSVTIIRTTTASAVSVATGLGFIATTFIEACYKATGDAP